MNLLSAVTVGPYRLPNRLVMAPMTRNRADPGKLPSELMSLYYAQRAGAGLIVTEGTHVSPQASHSDKAPGIFTVEQVAGWRRIADAVHAQGGHIFMQLWHVGRVAFAEAQPDGGAPVAPSAIAPRGTRRAPDGTMRNLPVPRALASEEIPGIVAQFREAAVNALAAGLDGVELHAANGYLLDQFLRSGSNRRSDRYGGSPDNRARLLLEVADAVIAVWGADRVGVRLSPTKSFNDMWDDDPEETFLHAVRALDRLGLAYLHLCGDPNDPEAWTREHAGLLPRLRQAFIHPVIMNGGYTRDSAEAAITTGAADLVSFGALFIANPDLPARFRDKAELNALDTDNIYAGGSAGYTSYPSRTAG